MASAPPRVRTYMLVYCRLMAVEMGFRLRIISAMGTASLRPPFRKASSRTAAARQNWKQASMVRIWGREKNSSRGLRYRRYPFQYRA